MNQEQVGKILKKIRQDNNLSQASFAEKLGVSPQAVSKWENGKNLPDIATLKMIKKEFNVAIDEIIDGESVTLVKSNKKKLIIVGLIILLIILIIGLFIFLKNNDDGLFKFDEVTSTNTDFKVTGNVVITDERTSLIINEVLYTGSDEDILYDELSCDLYEEKNNKNTMITSCDKGVNSTLEEYLKTLKIRMDHYAKNCTMFTETKMFIEIKAINDNKTITYKIPIEINENDCN